MSDSTPQNSATEILAFLDERFSIDRGVPPCFNLDWYYEYADARMSVFRSSEEWAILFEVVRFDSQVEEYKLDVWAYGNCLREFGYGIHGEKSQDIIDLYCRRAFDLCDNLDPCKPGDSWALNPAEFTIKFKGRVLKFAPTQAEYEAAGLIIDVDKGSGALAPSHLIRFVSHQLGTVLFASDDYLRLVMESCREAVQTSLFHRLELFLQTRYWHHPDIVADELPSQTQSFPILCRAIESGDLTEWNQQDLTYFNTHWSCWQAQRSIGRNWQDELNLDG